MSIFNPEQLLTATITEANTKRNLLTPGQEYTATVQDVKSVVRRNQDGFDTNVIDVKVSVNVPYEQLDAVGRETVDLTDSIWLDTNSAGLIDMGPGKNPKMKNWRDATDTNKAGKDFNFTQFVGRTVRIRVEHYVSKKDGETYEQVKGVTRA